MDVELLKDVWQLHKGKISGVAIGIVAGILIIVFGFFQTFFILACAAAGYLVGKRIDEKDDLVEVIDRLLPRSYRR